MDEKYEHLFKTMCQTVAQLAEQVMDYNKKQNNEAGYKSAEKMRNLYNELEDKITAKQTLNRNDFIQLLAMSYIIVNNIEERIKNEQKAVDHYKLDLIPKLSRIMNETKDSDDLSTLITELFTISQN